jgi:endothelin-converting enzyme/putative endopeptidase
MVLMTRVLVTMQNLIDWWTEGDLTRFTALGTALADQYSALEPLPGVHVDGKFTLGENIGLGGVNAAYDGLQLYLRKIKVGLIDGFTQSNVSLFLGPQFGEQNHVTKRLKSSKTDPHSPGMYRAYVPTQNVDAFIRHLTLKRRRNVYRT